MKGITGINIRGVLFDFDGTLTYPGALDFTAIRRELGCPEEIPILEYLGTLPKERSSQLLRILKLREEQAAERSIPNKGAVECLAVLKQKGILFGIFTRNSMRSVQRSLEGFRGITIDDFRAVITRDDSIPKPHPDGVYQAARLMRLSAAELMVVGDFRFDVMAGEAAGAVTVLLTNNGNSAMALEDPEPDYTVDSLEKILEIV